MVLEKVDSILPLAERNPNVTSRRVVLAINASAALRTYMKKKPKMDGVPIGSRSAYPHLFKNDIEPLNIPNALEAIFRRAASRNKKHDHNTKPKDK
jgi:hypothetical protein